MANMDDPTKQTSPRSVKDDKEATAAAAFTADEEPPVPAGKIRLSQALVDLVLAEERTTVFRDLCYKIMNRQPDRYTSQEDLDETREIYREAIKNHEEFQDDFARFREPIRQQYMEKGVVYVDDDYYEKVEKAKKANREAFLVP